MASQCLLSVLSRSYLLVAGDGVSYWPLWSMLIRRFWRLMSEKFYTRQWLGKHWIEGLNILFWLFSQNVQPMQRFRETDEKRAAVLLMIIWVLGRSNSYGYMAPIAVLLIRSGHTVGYWYDQRCNGPPKDGHNFWPASYKLWCTRHQNWPQVWHN